MHIISHSLVAKAAGAKEVRAPRQARSAPANHKFFCVVAVTHFEGETM
jgi:hypothetical protein